MDPYTFRLAVLVFSIVLLVITLPTAAVQLIAPNRSSIITSTL